MEAVSRDPTDLAGCVLDRGFEGLRVEGRHALDPPQTLSRVPDGEREHRLRLRGIHDVDEIVVTLRVVDRLDLDAQLVELCLGLADPLRLLACPLRTQITQQHIFHGYLHMTLIMLREGPCNYTPLGEPGLGSSPRLTPCPPVVMDSGLSPCGLPRNDDGGCLEAPSMGESPAAFGRFAPPEGLRIGENRVRRKIDFASRFRLIGSSAVQFRIFFFTKT